MIPAEQLNSLLMTDCVTITEEYLDEMGHMNVHIICALPKCAPGKSYHKVIGTAA